jgi:hypothetical protein
MRLKPARWGSDPSRMRAPVPVYTVSLLLALAAQAAEPRETIGGRDEAWWRGNAEERTSTVASLEHEVEVCEKTEAPTGADVVDGYGVGRMRGGPVLVPLKRCDEVRTRLEQARSDLERFEDLARQLDVPPGWLRSPN